MNEKFICNSCKDEFDLKDRGYFSYSQGNQCKKCWDRISKEIDKNQKRGCEIEEKEFEEKVRKIVNKVLDERKQ